MENPFTILFRASYKPTNSVSTASTFCFGISGFGKSVTERTAIQLSTVYVCVWIIAETVASLSLGVYENSVEGSSKARTIRSTRSSRTRWLWTVRRLAITSTLTQLRCTNGKMKKQSGIATLYLRIG